MLVYIITGLLNYKSMTHHKIYIAQDQHDHDDDHDHWGFEMGIWYFC